MPRLLFLCSQNKLRSPTAEQVFSQVPGISVRSAGLDKGAEYELSSDDVEWAEIIFVMETSHRNKLLKKFKKFITSQRIIVLGIPDDYEYMEPALIELLKNKVSRFL